MASTPTASLSTIPLELLRDICEFVPQHGLTNLMLANSSFFAIASEYLYHEPQFASTYRFAQFTYLVVNNPHYARKVRSLDLSQFTRRSEINQKTGEYPPSAGWREFKYRHHDMFHVHDKCESYPSVVTSSNDPEVRRKYRDEYTSLYDQRAAGIPFSYSSKTHPAPSPMLKSFHTCRDVPIGGICHILSACHHIKKINMTGLQLASDFIVTTLSSHKCRNRSQPTPPPRKVQLQPASQTSKVPYLNSYIIEPEQTRAHTTFVSDVPKSWTWEATELSPIYADSIIMLLGRMRELEVLEAQMCMWMSAQRVKKILREAPRPEETKKSRNVKGLQIVDFRGCGMEKDPVWAVKGARGVVESLFGDDLWIDEKGIPVVRVS